MNTIVFSSLSERRAARASAILRSFGIEAPAAPAGTGWQVRVLEESTDAAIELLIICVEEVRNA